MKRYTIHTFSALALLLAATACTQDDAVLLPEAPEGIPMTFTATGLTPATDTRATVDGDWKGVTAVAIQIGNEVKAYRVTPSSDNLTATLSSDDPHYWAGESAVTVSAWWPYTDGQTSMPAVTVQADQRGDGYAQSDHIGVAEELLHYNGGTPTLAFTHRTARIVVTVSGGTSSISSVRLTNLSTADGNPGEIIAHHAGSGIIYEALVAPQSVASGTAFITCEFTNGKVFVYKMENDADWQAGKEYTYTVSLAAADPGYTYDSNTNTYTVYSAKGLLAWNEAAQSDLSTNCTLATDITLPAVDEGKSNWTPVGTSSSSSYTGTFDGGNYTITGLTVTGSNEYAGLFGDIDENSTVKNVVLEGVQITSDNSSGFVGGVAGNSFRSNIENCSVSGSVSGSYVGGVVGYQWGGTITGCSSSATVNAGIVAGGIAGETNSGASLTACYAMGDVTLESINQGDNFVGGVVGYNGGSSTLTACYAAGNVSGSGRGTIHVGGVTGHNSGTMTACYWSGLPDNDNGGATKVDGTNVTWQTAVAAMNAALSGKGWQYELKDGNSLPALKKEQ